jgi:hypothetical protein
VILRPVFLVIFEPLDGIALRFIFRDGNGSNRTSSILIEPVRPGLMEAAQTELVSIRSGSGGPVRTGSNRLTAEGSKTDL